MWCGGARVESLDVCGGVGGVGSGARCWGLVFVWSCQQGKGEVLVALD